MAVVASRVRLVRHVDRPRYVLNVERRAILWLTAPREPKAAPQLPSKPHSVLSHNLGVAYIQ